MSPVEFHSKGININHTSASLRASLRFESCVSRRLLPLPVLAHRARLHSPRTKNIVGRTFSARDMKSSVKTERRFQHAGMWKKNVCVNTSKPIPRESERPTISNSICSDVHLHRQQTTTSAQVGNDNCRCLCERGREEGVELMQNSYFSITFVYLVLLIIIGVHVS